MLSPEVRAQVQEAKFDPSSHEAGVHYVYVPDSTREAVIAKVLQQVYNVHNGWSGVALGAFRCLRRLVGLSGRLRCCGYTWPYLWRWI